MRKALGSIFGFLAIIVFVGFGLCGFIMELVIVNRVAGFWGVVI